MYDIMYAVFKVHGATKRKRIFTLLTRLTECFAFCGVTAVDNDYESLVIDSQNFVLLHHGSRRDVWLVCESSYESSLSMNFHKLTNLLQLVASWRW